MTIQEIVAALVTENVRLRSAARNLNRAQQRHQEIRRRINDIEGQLSIAIATEADRQDADTDIITARLSDEIDAGNVVQAEPSSPEPNLSDRL